MRAEPDAGFTLIEILVSVFIVGIVLGTLVSYTGDNLAALGKERRALEALRLGEQRVRELQAELRAGGSLRDGVDEGTFDDADADLAWRTRVESVGLPLPAGYVGEPPSAVFKARPTPQEPSLKRVEVRVYPVDADPDDAEPLVFFALAPPRAPAEATP